MSNFPEYWEKPTEDGKRAALSISLRQVSGETVTEQEQRHVKNTMEHLHRDLARGSYDETATVKLSPEQHAYVKASDEPVSQWIRDAVQERIDRENNGTGWPEVHPSEHPGLH